MDVFNNKPFSASFVADESDPNSQFDDGDYITYSLYDLEGNVIDDINNKEVDIYDLSDKSRVSITIPAEANYLDENDNPSNRLIVVDYSIGGVEKSKRIGYKVIPFVPYTCDKDSVRNLLGVSSTVIEDDMIDIYSAYLKCKSLFEDETVLDTSLKSYGIESVKANRAISICSALTFRSSLMLLTPKIESDSVVSQTRFTMSAEDFAKLFDDLQDELDELISDLEEENLVSGYAPELFVVGDLTDTFTGG